MPGPLPYADARSEDRTSEQGIALILAILALLLLTFLGLTLTTTTSTEVQIANNFKWSQQALYNAEAGLEAARRIITQATPAVVLPPIRLPAWNPAQTTPAGPPPTPPFGGGSRNFENQNCDTRGNGTGYGAVLHDGTANGPYQNVTTLFGAPLQGAVTIWVRRRVQTQGTIVGYQANDHPDPARFIVTVEGVAPSLNSPNRAIRLIESEVNVTASGTGCDDLDTAPQASQTGFFSECPAP